MSDTVVFPRLDQDMQDGTITGWLVEVGDQVQAGDEIAEMETAKVTAAIESPRSGVILAILVDAGQIVDVGNPIAVIGDEGEEAPSDLKPKQDDAAPAKSDDRSPPQPTAPRPAVAGGPQPVPPRVLALPVDRSSWERPHERSPRARYAARTAERTEPAGPLSAPRRVQPGRGHRVELNSVRRATIRTVEASWQIPQFSVEAEVATEPLGTMLADLRRLAPEPRVTLTDVLAAAMARTAAAVPAVNAWFEGDAIHLFDEVDLSLMVQTDRGLYVPVLRDVQVASIRRIAEMRQRAVRAAQDGTLDPVDLEPGTIALSNLGMFNIHRFNALLYPPQVAVLAVGRARAGVDGAPMWLTLTVDHRAVDGATAAQYLEEMSRLLADPMLVLI